MTIELVYNTTDTIAVVDDDGRTIGGREWGSADIKDQAAKRLLNTGDLVLADEESARNANLPVVAALDKRRERADQARRLNTEQLREAVEAAGGEANDASKTELVREVSADPSIELPTPPKAAAKSGRSSASGN